MRTKDADDARNAPWWPSAIPALAIVLFGVAHAASTPPRSLDETRLVVTQRAGQVDVTVAGATADVAPNETLPLPARIVTGHDGTLGLTQAGTAIAVSHDSDVEIPAEVVDGNLIARLVQHRGNVFYDVAKRDAGKLRVETPLLVAVIKGTQFNVAVQQDTTTISLFEGSLDIRTPDTDQVVQLEAGQIAIRTRGVPDIRVVGMNDARLDAPRTPLALAAARETAARLLDAQPSPLVGRASAPLSGVAATIGQDPLVAAGVSLGGESAKTGLDLSVSAPTVALDAGLALGGSSAAVSLDAQVGIAAAGVTLDTSLSAGGLELGLGVTAGLSTGPTLDVGIDTGLAAAGGSVGLDLGAGVDLGGGTALGVAAGVDLGLDTGLSGGSPGASLDLSAALGGGGLDTGLDLGLGVDLGAATGLDVELTLGDIDLGGDTADSPSTEPPPAPPRLGGLLGGLL